MTGSQPPQQKLAKPAKVHFSRIHADKIHPYAL